MDTSPCIGIDVSEAWLDVSVHPSRQHWRCKTSPAALASLSKRLHSLSPRVVAFEASGGYERSLAEALKQAGLSFAVINPRNVRSYARSIGVLAKTDRIDAAVIAEFAHVTKVEPKTPPSPAEQAARDLVTRRAQLVADQTREKHHCRHASGPSLASAERHLAFLKQEIAAVEQKLRQVIAGDAALRARRERLVTVPGVGATLAAVLVATLPELGRVNRAAVAMLVGVAPLARDSRKSEGKRFCWGGRSIVQMALYMPMLSAIRHNPAMHAFYHG